MEEKAKRGEKPKNKAKRAPTNPAFVWVTVMLIVVFLGGIGFAVYTLTAPSYDEPSYPSTEDPIKTQNAIHLTQISASQTAYAPAATATELANSTRRAELRQTTTVQAAFTATSRQATELANATVTAHAQATASANAATAAYLIPIVSQTALVEDLTATERAAPTASVVAAFNATSNAIQTESSIRLSQISNTIAALTQSAISPTPSCGSSIYSGSTESHPHSDIWRENLLSDDIKFVYARVFYDAFEAVNDCRGGITPLPYKCIRLEIALSIDAEDWGNAQTLGSLMIPILASIDETALCDEPDAELRVYYFPRTSDFHYWWVERATILEAYRNGASPEAVWELGTADDED